MWIIHLILILIMLILVSFAEVAEDVACNNSNEALYIDPAQTNTNKEEAITLCPARPTDEINKSEADSNQYRELKYCLYEKNSTPSEEKLCKYEPKPVLYVVRDKNNQKVRCGFKKTQFLHHFGYLHCMQVDKKQQANLQNAEINVINTILIKYIVTYTVCYDISKQKTIWTSHQILSPFIFLQPDFKEEKYCPNRINTDPFYPNSEERYLKLEEDYYNEMNKPTTNFPMMPHPMVSAKHFAFRIWKKSTNHYINISPLWNRLDNLMAAIDEGIKKSANRVYLDNVKSNKNKLYTGLIIYAKTKTVFSLREKFLDKILGVLGFFQPSIWYKFVYYPEKKQGVMIYIYNTPGKWVDQKKKEKKKKIYSCDFEKWIGDKQIREEIRLNLLENYAYCDKATPDSIKKLFSIDVELGKEIFDIDSLSKM